MHISGDFSHAMHAVMMQCEHTIGLILSSSTFKSLEKHKCFQTHRAYRGNERRRGQIELPPRRHSDICFTIYEE